MYDDFFRPINYLGSKFRLVEIIKSVIDELNTENEPILDLFSGSGTVSKYLSYTYPIISLDIQEYSKIINSALLLPTIKTDTAILHSSGFSSIKERITNTYEPLIIFENEAIKKISDGKYNAISELVEFGPLNNIHFGIPRDISDDFLNALKKVGKDKTIIKDFTTNITDFYGGVFFSYSQAVYIDSCLNYLRTIDEPSRRILHAAVISTVSDISNTIGKQFAQPLSPINSKGKIKLNIMEKILKDRSISFEITLTQWIDKYNRLIQPAFNNIVLKCDYKNAFLDNLFYKVIYADPPYTRYHYSRYYHVLETIALLDNPLITESIYSESKRYSKGVYRSDRHQSPFGLKTRAPSEFDNLFKLAKARNSSIVLSYSPYNTKSISTPRVLKVEELINIANKYYHEVEVISCGAFIHSKLNKSDLHLDALEEAELLIVAKV